MNTPRLVVFAVLGAALCSGGCETTSSTPTASSAPTPLGGGQNGAAAATPGYREVFDLKQLDRTPVVRYQRPPQYPLELRRAGVSGEAVVDFIIGPDGNVYDAYAARETQPSFGAAAVECVASWKFQPGTKGGKPVWTHMQVPIVFTLNGR